MVTRRASTLPTLARNHPFATGFDVVIGLAQPLFDHNGDPGLELGEGKSSSLSWRGFGSFF